MQRGLGKIGRGNADLSNHNLNPSPVSGGLRFDLRLAAPSTTWEEDEQAPIGAGLFSGRAHETVDQLLVVDLTRYRVGYTDHRGQIKLVHRGENRTGIGRSFLRPDLGI